MDEAFEVFRSGAVGFFSQKLRRVNDDEGWERGHLRLDRDGDIHVITLNEDVDSSPLFEPEGKHPDYLLGFTEHGSMLMIGIHGRGATSHIGGSKASVFRYRGQTMVLGFNPETLRTHRIKSATAYFYGLGRWAGVAGSRENRTKNADGTLKSWSVTLSSPEPQFVELRNGLRLGVGTYWRADGPVDRRTLHAPLAVSVEAGRHREAQVFLVTLLRLQELASLAYDGFVVARGGRVELDAAPSKHAELWHRSLMSVPDAVKPPKSMNARTLFDVSDLGGLSGLARWIKVARDHWRAVGPVTYVYRTGTPAIEQQLLSVCAGIEYWVAVNRRQKKQWAKEKFIPAALAERVGEPFVTWVGDASAWADRLWRIYNELKHDPAAAIDTWSVYLMAQSARYLLAAALLDRAAWPKRVSPQMFDRHRLYQLGEQIRAELGA